MPPLPSSTAAAPDAVDCRCQMLSASGLTTTTASSRRPPLQPPVPPPSLPQRRRVLLAPREGDDDDNDDNNDNKDDEDDLVRFVNDASLTLSPLDGNVGGPMNTAAAVAVAAANANC